MSKADDPTFVSILFLVLELRVKAASMGAGVQAVDIYGRIPQVIAAQGKISAVLAQEAGAWAADTDWGVRICMQFLPEMASLLIGKKGSTIQGIQAQSGARVRVAREEGAVVDLQPVTVRSPEACKGHAAADPRCSRQQCPYGYVRVREMPES
jgi:hypothetical protein